MQSRDQERAKMALDHVQSLKQSENQSVADKYGNLCLKLPTLLQTNGILQTLAFIEVSKDKANALILQHIADQLSYQKHKLISSLSSASVGEYIASSRELQRCLVWYKRFSISILEAKGDD